MALMLRSVLRNPVATRSLSRALRRLDDDMWLDPWPVKRMRRSALPSMYESPAMVFDDMNRQMNAALERMQEFADDLEAFDSMVDRFDTATRDNRSRGLRRRRGVDMQVTRTESGGLQLALDVGNFKPEDLKIKLLDDNLIVEASNESSAEDSYRKSHFKRWFKLPEDCKVDEIKSKLTADNRLLIELPSNKPDEKQAKQIPIEMEKRAPSVEANQTTAEASSKQSS